MSYLFSFSRSQTKNMLLSPDLDTLFRCIYEHPLKQYPTRKERGEDGNTKM